MSKFEKKKLNMDKHQTGKDRGSYGVEIELGDDDEIKAKIDKYPDVKDKEFIKNEKEFINSDMRDRSLNDLAEIWWQEMGMEEIMKEEEMEKAFNRPENFINLLENLEKKENIEEFSNDLEELSLKIKIIIPKLETKQVEMTDELSDYKETEDDILNQELKMMLRKRVEFIKDKIDNGKQVLDFIEEKKNEILL